MRKHTWMVMLLALAFILTGSLAAAQKEYESEESEEAKEDVMVQMPMMGQMMPGCQMMAGGQTPGQPMQGCRLIMPGGEMMGQMGCCAMGPAGCCGMRGPGMGMAGCGIGMGGGMAGCGMAGPGPQMMWVQKGQGCGTGQMGGGLGMGCGPGMGCGMMQGGPGCGLCGDMCQSRCASCYLKFADELELIEKQVSALKDIRSAERKAMIQKRADIQIAEAELQEIVSADVPDFAKIRTKISQVASLKESMRLEHINALEKAYKVLTAEQQKKFKALMKGTCGAGTPQKVEKRVKIIEK